MQFQRRHILARRLLSERMRKTEEKQCKLRYHIEAVTELTRQIYLETDDILNGRADLESFATLFPDKGNE